MEFSIVGALVAGFVATAVMTVMMKLAGAAGMTQMPPMELITGAMMSGDERRARQLGYVLHWIVIGTVVFGLIYAALFAAIGSTSWLVGLVIGLVHAVVVGVALSMMPAMHPRVSGSPTAEGHVSTINGEVHLSSPGVFGAAWGGMTPIGLLMGHAVYGIVLAIVYQQLISY